MEKKRLLISFSNLPADVVQTIRSKYPYGYNHHVMEVKGANDKKMYVLPIETKEATYLVKVDINKPVTTAQLEDLYAEDEEYADVESNDDLPDEEIVVDDED